MPILSCRDVTLKYGSLTAVEGLSFEVNEGDYLSIVGENGSGKSTLIKALLGLMKPSSGSIIYDGVTSGEIGYLPQQTAVQRDFPATVWEVVLSGNLGRRGKRLPFYSREEKGRADAMLSQLGIEELKGRSIRALSGGQRQRVLLARALCAAKKMILLDEPAAALDPAASAELYSLIDHLNRDHGVTVIMVTHSMEAARHSGKILHMGRREHFFGTAGEFFESGRADKMTGGEDHV